MTEDKEAKIVTKEINKKAKLNKADLLLKLKNNSLEELKKILKRVMEYNNKVDYTSSQSTRTINGLDDLSKDELIEKIMKLRSKRKDGQLIPSGYFDLSIPLRTGIEHYEGGGYSKRKKGRFRIRA
jgi:hypothetical protein